MRKAGRWPAVLLAVLMFALAASGLVFAAGPADSGTRVFDGAGLFAESERQELEEMAKSLLRSRKQDFVVVTTDNSMGYSGQEYADNFYDQGGFGTRDNYSGTLFLIDMDTRDLAIVTSGDMTRVLTDERIGRILDEAYVHASEGRYAEAAKTYLTMTENYIRSGIEANQYNYDTETGRISPHKSVRWYEFLLALAVPGFVAASVCAGVKNSYAMKKERQLAGNFQMSYRADSAFNYRNQADMLLNSFVTQAVIASAIRNSGRGGGFGGGMGGGGGRSSTHTTSMGRTHGGGSRKF